MVRRLAYRITETLVVRQPGGSSMSTSTQSVSIRGKGAVRERESMKRNPRVSRFVLLQKIIAAAAIDRTNNELLLRSAVRRFLNQCLMRI